MASTILKDITCFSIVALLKIKPKNHHIDRKFRNLIDLDKIAHQHLTTIVGNSHYKGYDINTLFKTLLLQHLEDLSDRELQRFLQENNDTTITQSHH